MPRQRQPCHHHRCDNFQLISVALSGSIPIEIATILTFDLSRCEFYTTQWYTLPTELGRLINLTHFDVHGLTYLTGTLPTELGTLSHLSYLDVSSFIGFLYGTLPSGKLSSTLTHWSVAGLRQLTGTIPTQLGQLVPLQHWDCSNTQLNGTIPTELGNLSHLTTVWTGHIPPKLGHLTALKNLDLTSNGWIGTLPTEIGNLIHLTSLSIRDTHLYRIVADGTRTFDALANARCTIESMEWYIAIGTGTIVSTCRSGCVCVTLDWSSSNGIVRTSGRAGDIGDQRRL